MSTTSIIEFCNKHNIKWFPIAVCIIKKNPEEFDKQLSPIKHTLYRSYKQDKKNPDKTITVYRPSQSDFKNCSEDKILQRQKMYFNEDSKKKFNLNYIAVDTRNVYHIDIDIKDNDPTEPNEYFQDIQGKSPYYKSLTKKKGVHIFVKGKLDSELNRIQFSQEDIELLSGQWGWCSVDTKVENSDKDIYECSNINKHLQKRVVRKIKNQFKKPKTPKNDILSDIKVDPKEAEALDSLIKYACEQKNIKFHTHEIITLTSKGLVNSGFIEQGKQLVLNSMNNKNKDLNAIWMDCRNNAYKTQRKKATFYYYFKQIFGNDTFYNITNKFQEHHLVQSLYDDLYTVQSNNINEINERYIPESVIDTIKDNKITFLKSHLGTGKTTIMKKIIKDHPGASILYLAPRIAFGKQIHSELDNFTFYGDLKKNSKPDMKQRIIIQMESLHKIQGIKYDIVVCDEIESCLKQLSSTETMKHNIMKNHDIFEKAILNAKRVICCDAFLSNKTIQVMNSINNLSQFKGNTSNATIINTFNPYKRKSFEFQNEKKLLAELWRKLNNGKRVVFVCGSKSKAQTINDLFIKKYKDSKTSMFYYGSMSEQDKDFSNVEQTWSKLDLLIYTPVITCGVNYDPKIPTFDCLFMYATASSACIRDVFQSSLRVRKLNENHLLYVINPTSKQRNEFVFGLSENIMKVQELANFVLSKTELYNYTESKPWVRLNYAHNLNEEGINKHFYTQTFRDMLKICGYEDKMCTTDNNKENKIDSTFTPLKDVESIDKDIYDELKRNPYALTEDEKLSITHYECSKVFQIDDEVWERVSRNTAILENVTYEFKYSKNAIQVLTEKEANNVNEIYAKNLAEKTIAIKELNEIMGFKDSYNICYETKFVKNNQKKIQAYLEKYQQLWNLRTTQGKDWFRYANSKIKQIYMKWNGCEIKADQNKNKIKDKVKKNRKSSYTYKLVGPLNSSVMI